MKCDGRIEWSSRSILDIFPTRQVVCSQSVTLAANSSQVRGFAVKCMFSSGETHKWLMCVAAPFFILFFPRSNCCQYSSCESKAVHVFCDNVSYRWGCQLLGLLLKMKYLLNSFLCFNIWCCLMPCDNLVLHNLPGTCRDKWIIHMDRKFSLPTHF